MRESFVLNRNFNQLKLSFSMWLDVVGCGWLDVVGCGWMWLNVVECG